MTGKSCPHRMGWRSSLEHLAGQIDLAVGDQLRRNILDTAGVSLQQIPCALMAFFAQNVALGFGNIHNQIADSDVVLKNREVVARGLEHVICIRSRNADGNLVHQRKTACVRDVGAAGVVLVENLDADNGQCGRRRAVGELLGENKKRVDGLERVIAALRERIEAMEGGEKRLKPVVPFDKGSIIA